MVVADKCFNNLSATSQNTYKQGCLSLFSSRWEMFFEKNFFYLFLLNLIFGQFKISPTHFTVRIEIEESADRYVRSFLIKTSRLRDV